MGTFLWKYTPDLFEIICNKTLDQQNVIHSFVTLKEQINLESTWHRLHSRGGVTSFQISTWIPRSSNSILHQCSPSLPTHIKFLLLGSHSFLLQNMCNFNTIIQHFDTSGNSMFRLGPRGGHLPNFCTRMCQRDLQNHTLSLAKFVKYPF